MKKILYIGNKLSSRGLSPTTVDTLAPLLNTIYDVKSVSDKKNIITRAIDIVFTVIKSRKNIDLIIIDTYSTKNFYITVIVAFISKIFGLKYIPYLHGGNLPDRIISSPKLSNFIFKNSIVNVAPSNYIGRAFIENGYKTIIIPNNIDLSMYKFKERNKLRPKLLYVRAFEKTYNPQMAIKVLQNIVKVYPKTELCMVGPDKDGTLKDIENLIQEFSLTKNIKITGKLSKEEWIKLSEDYDIFVNTTNFDNQPVSVIEAMALGFSIVSTNVGGIPFLIDNLENGILVKPNDIKDMTSQILNLIDNDLLSNKLSIKAREKAEEFDWENIKNKWINLIEEASNKKEKNVN